MTITPTDLANLLLGGGISISNVQYTGANIAAGTFNGGTGIIGFDSGIILSSGNISDVIGPNSADWTTTDLGLPGDADLDLLIPGYTTYDATVLEFDFVPTSSVVTFQYVFGSEEYNEWVYSSYNDVFGFFVNGQNVALIPGTTTPVSINNVNGGNPFGTNPSNPAYYINNDLSDGGGSIDTELDGLTVVLTATVNVNPGVTNHIKLAIADAGDHVLDSDVFIKAASFTAPKLTLEPLTATNPVGSSHTLTAKLVDANGNPISGQTITFTVTAGPNVGLTGTGVTDNGGFATWSYTGTVVGTDTIVAAGPGETSNNAFKTWEGATLPVLTLEPLTATNTVGSSHTLTAKLADANGNPILGQTITFTVTAGPNVGVTGTDVTDTSGFATWSYTGATAGTDTIVASGAGVTSNSASKTWEEAPPEVKGRMTGGGSVFMSDGTRVTHGFELNCDANKAPNNLQVNWGKNNKFHLGSLSSASCIDDPNIISNPPAAGFDTYTGSGTGSYNGVSGATIDWIFTDAGEPGRNDFAKIVIKDVYGNVVLSVLGNLKNGNHQAHAE